MAILYNLTFVCDNCEEEFYLGGEALSMPPFWITAQITISNKEGLVPDLEENAPLLHFCTQKCLSEFISSQEFKERILLIDKKDEDDQNDEDEEEKDNE
ncbi:MAG: hypothetical protein WC755_02100 [Candidatus Woesearchaeota archaeon]|jgi:hypothetical protein